MHHNDVKLTHNIYYMVLHGMMRVNTYRVNDFEKIMRKKQKIAIFVSKLCILTHVALILK